MKLEKISLGKLSLDPANARKHTQKNLDAVKGSLARFGQQKPIVVDKKGVVIAGNGTLLAARELGWTELFAYRTDLEGIDKTAFALADNRTAELAEWDDDILGKTLHGLRELDFDLMSIGFDVSALDGDLDLPPPPDPDDGSSDDDGVARRIILHFDEAQYERLLVVTDDLMKSKNLDNLSDLFYLAIETLYGSP